MSNYDEIDAACDRIIQGLELLADRVLEQMNIETEKAVDLSYQEYGEYETELITNVFTGAVQSFYDSYSPKEYQRSYGLFDVLDIKRDEHGLAIYEAPNYDELYDGEKMHSGRSGNDLYELVFKEGYHGGAKDIGDGADVWGAHPSPGTPYYRKGGLVKYPGINKRRWHKYGKWGRPAVKSKSAYKLISETLNSEEPMMDAKFEEIVHQNNNAAMDSVKKKIPELKAQIFG